jgi:hypothetical protein
MLREISRNVKFIGNVKRNRHNSAFLVGYIQAAIAAISMFSIPQHSKKLTGTRAGFVSNCLQMETMYFMLRY